MSKEYIAVSGKDGVTTMFKGGAKCQAEEIRYFMCDLLDSEDREFTAGDLKKYYEEQTGKKASAGAYGSAINRITNDYSNYKKTGRNRYRRIEGENCGSDVNRLFDKIKVDCIECIEKSINSINVNDITLEDMKKFKSIRKIYDLLKKV